VCGRREGRAVGGTPEKHSGVHVTCSGWRRRPSRKHSGNKLIALLSFSSMADRLCFRRAMVAAFK
jgi:hypothetical protein